MRDVPRVDWIEQLVHSQFQYRRAGSADTAGVNFLHDLYFRDSSSQALSPTVAASLNY